MTGILTDSGDRFRAGDEAAFAELTDACAGHAWRVVWRIVRNTQDAEDAMQEALERAWKYRRSYRNSGAFQPWFISIAARCALKIAERSSRAPDPLIIPENASGKDAENFEAARALAGALAKLSPHQRATVILVDLEDRTIAETAEALGCSTGSVSQHLARGRARLRELLGGLR